ncbi:cytochrome c oxidase accessory protein CcoG [Taibaiella soli]|uniref:Cytochrome c oxidase accessory protein CcoG n=2 Tax=Taibaiella soli TaxID=1649169 RepID=A0A2W2ATR5_9BACT|nr:cytochrome c oxidase accessory protein CcoG [Taibaiella soli]
MNDNNAQLNESFRDKVATVDEKGKRIWVYPQKPQGKFYNARTWLSIVYFILFFTLPFIKVNGHPLFLINVIERRFILFGQIFWPQDFFIFGLGMVLFVVFVALFTVVFGRLFCGWICPQTIFMEMVFRKIEYFIEGNAAEQKILAKAQWNTDKIFKKSAKWISFWALSFLISNTFLAYVIGIDELRKVVVDPLNKHVGGFAAILIFTTVFFFVFAWMREQVCTTICPYGRLQGVLLDRNSIVVAYDHERGEQRGKFNKKETRTIGDCIDCHQCVKVCPTGIDIRNGTQLECINCTACIDACNKMMEAVNLPTGLIRYASEANISDKKKTTFTGRMKAYSAVMAVLLIAESFLLVSRTDVGITILRTPGQLYQKQPNHQLSNLYNYKLLNKTYQEMNLHFEPENFKGRIELVGEKNLKVPKGGDLTGSLFVYMDSTDIRHTETDIKIGVWQDGKKIKIVNTSFLGPFTEY